ncbi:MAG TPA: phosphoribosylformylglycinamidine cyclo-ligase [Candidatus Limnocylindrales bacterium]|jgi:phosphoribosylformylglycinamidine cyclo-ligase|nr:phosphoribosylformylglycinamidine cyclo-ligase [Candidatus Limnocylindrales bacterium]
MTDRTAYREAGVDLEAGERAVELIRERLARSGDRPGQGSGRPGWPERVGGLGGFAAAVGMPRGYRDPLLVSGADGVGTKTAIAAALGRYASIGQDLVAMCADDVACAGARPLFLLDYVAVGRLDPEVVAELVDGIAAACEVARCALVGGETAEHPGLIEPGEFDLAGFCLGVVERDQLLDGSAARPGDVLLGLGSSGLHSNGYSLVRALVARHQLALDQPYVEVVAEILGEAAVEPTAAEEPELALATFGDVLLIPSRIYASDVLDLRDALEQDGTPLRGLAHITGGGLPTNVPRALPERLGARIDPASWPVPSIAELVGALGDLEEAEVRATLNAGVGMVAVLPVDALDRAARFLESRRVPSWPIGEVVESSTLGGRYAEVAR